MSVALVQLPPEFFEAMSLLYDKLESMNESIENAANNTAVLVELIKKNNELLQKIAEQLTEIKNKTE